MMLVRPSQPVDHTAWDQFIERSNRGTVMHSRRFLGYHGTRFLDRSVVVENENEEWAALMPMAVRHDQQDVAVSHPGAPFGGIVTSRLPLAEKVEEIFDAVCHHLAATGIRQLIYRQPPCFVGEQPDGVDLQVLAAKGARITPCNLWSVANLQVPRRVSKGRKWGANKARAAGITVALTTAVDDYRIFHRLLTTTLEERHAALPLHDLGEMLDLRERLGADATIALVRTGDGIVCAASWLIRYQAGVWHTQYIASTEEGRKLKTVDLLMEAIADCALANDARWLSLGSSASGDPLGIDPGLFAFKTGCGCGSVMQWEASLDL